MTGALTLNVIPCALIFSRHVESGARASFAQYANISLFKKMSFYILCFHYFFMAGFSIFLILSVRFATEYRGIAQDDAPLMLSTQGISNIFGRLFAVVVSSNQWTSSKTVRYAVFHVATIGGGLATLFYTFTGSFLGLCVCTGGAGFCIGCRWALLPGLQMDELGTERFSTSWSYGMFIMGVGSLLMPPLGGWYCILSYFPSEARLLSQVRRVFVGDMI